MRTQKTLYEMEVHGRGHFWNIKIVQQTISVQDFTFKADSSFLNFLR